MIATMKRTDNTAPPYAKGKNSAMMYRSILNALSPSQCPASITQLNPKKALNQIVTNMASGLFMVLLSVRTPLARIHHYSAYRSGRLKHPRVHILAPFLPQRAHDLTLRHAGTHRAQDRRHQVPVRPRRFHNPAQPCRRVGFAPTLPRCN